MRAVDNRNRGQVLGSQPFGAKVGTKIDYHREDYVYPALLGPVRDPSASGDLRIVAEGIGPSLSRVGRRSLDLTLTEVDI